MRSDSTGGQQQCTVRRCRHVDHVRRPHEHGDHVRRPHEHVDHVRRHRVALRVTTLMLVVTGVVIGLTACSGSGSTVSSGPMLTVDELALAKSVGKKVGTNVTVTCPDDVPLRKGEVTLCTVTDGIYVNELILTQEDDAGNVAWKVGKVLSGPSS